tara:strand:- start:11 stop:166 length:156 start_codon:yes stop_codon:yes gene_type:complete
MVMRRKRTKINFTKTGFTQTGLINYAKLRRRGIGKEKAISKLIKEDKRRRK